MSEQWDWHDYITRYCCHTGCGRKNHEPHAADCPRDPVTGRLSGARR